jgi:hypothetical protein
VDKNPDRRQFLRAASALGLGAGLGGLVSVTPTHASELIVNPEAVRLRPEIEPVVRWIEETPRDRVFEVALKQLRDGLSYRDLMAGLFLAGIRNIKPRPVGFKFHAVMVINSAHLLAQTARVEERLLPMFWALDNFKSSQAQDVKEGDWTLSAVDEARVPSPAQANATFTKSMESWDADAADAAVAGLCRSAGAAEVMEAFWRYAIRDQRNIGHKPIFAMQCWRTLHAIGWEHAEPELRSLAFGLLDLQQDSQAAPLGPYDSNLERTRAIRADWPVGRADRSATRSLVDAIRQGSPDQAADKAVELLNAGIAPQALWDAVVLSAGELMVRSPGILALHAVTSTNALHYIHTVSGDDTNRKLALLQAVGWIPLFRDRVKPPAEPDLLALEPADPVGQGPEAVAEIFNELERDRQVALRKAMGYLEKGGSADAIYALGRTLIFHKGRDSHDYKFGAAAWEEHRLVSDPAWQPALLASSLIHIPGSARQDSPLMRRARDAVEQVLGGKA